MRKAEMRGKGGLNDGRGPDDEGGSDGKNVNDEENE